MNKIFGILLLGMLFLVAFLLVGSKADSWYAKGIRHVPYAEMILAQSAPNYSRFYKMKVDIKRDVQDNAFEVAKTYSPKTLEVSKVLFKKLMEASLAQYSNIKYKVFYEPSYNTQMNDVGVLVASVEVEYKDKIDSIAWRYDIVFEQNITPVVIVKTLNKWGAK